MKICFIADANSIHARSWIEYFCRPGNEVFVLSTARNPIPLDGARVYDLHTGKTVRPPGTNPAAKGEGPVRRLVTGTPDGRAGGLIIRALKRLYETGFSERTQLLYHTLRLTANARAILKELQPDIVHCLRLPVEGYIGGRVGYHPLIISSWGDDFVFFAGRYLLFRRLTEMALRKADAHFADNARDLKLAGKYGFAPAKPANEVPGCGGLKFTELPARAKGNSFREKIGVARDANLMLSPRGFTSPFMNMEGLLTALPEVIKKFPNTVCVFIGDTRSIGYLKLMGQAEKLNIEEHCRFVNRLEHAGFLDYLAASDIMVSPSRYDGCPNSMLEAMACGAIPVMSSHCPVERWITDGWNGYFFNPRDPENIAQVIIKALENRDSFEAMRQRNRQIAEEKADYFSNMKAVEKVYGDLVK